MSKRTPQEIIQEAEELLQTAKFGLEDMRYKPERHRTGLRNAVVFGRNTTFALQNLRGVLPGFDEWYVPRQKEMSSNPLLKFFHNLRNKIEKQASTPTTSATHVHTFNANDLNKFPRPLFAKGFFLGDQNGGSGWIVSLPSGKEEKYYINLPVDIAESEVYLADAPTDNGQQRTAIELVESYLQYVEALLYEARQVFGI